jgi:hypothetical protein
VGEDVGLAVGLRLLERGVFYHWVGLVLVFSFGHACLEIVADAEFPGLLEADLVSPAVPSQEEVVPFSGGLQ